MSLRQLMSQDAIDEFFFNRALQNTNSNSTVKGNDDEKIKLLHETAKQHIRANRTEAEIILELIKQGITADYASLIILNAEEDILKQKEFWKDLIAGVTISVVTIILNYLSYENTLPGGSYLIIWGTFVFGAAMITRAFILFRK